MFEYKQTPESLTCILKGKIDLLASEKITGELEQFNLALFPAIVFDMKEVIYVSSSFLGIIAKISKEVGKDKIVIKNVNAVILKVLEIVNFKEICKIE